MPKIVASLFSGCGGLDLGFTGGFTFRGQNYDRLNTEILFANDFDQDAQSCYNANPLLTNDGANCGSPDKPGGLSIQLCKSEKKEFYIRYSS